MSWTDERVETLKKLWGDGLSASQIANELGSATRNAVLGKVNRLGLSGRANSPRPGRPARQRKPRAHSHMMRVRPQMRGNTALAYQHDLEVEPDMIENIIPMGQRCTLLELSEDKCRWPIGDPGSTEFFFCGGKPTEGAPYCSFHSRLAYQPAPRTRPRLRPLRRRPT